jgi:two-component system chemotaxis response regulator CheB
MTEHFKIVVIGASAGGIEALVKVMTNLPHDINAAFLVVVHISPTASGVLPQILNRYKGISAAYPLEGQIVQPGKMYVAPPDWHLLLGSDDQLELTRGPREHTWRPAIDPLFRSAATYAGPRCIGVVLSGMLDDGTAGLIEIKRAGGIAIVQDPRDALFDGMPNSALTHVDIDFTLRAQSIGELIGDLCSARHKTGPRTEVVDDEQRHLEVEIDRLTSSPHDTKKLGNPSEFACPECGGTLWAIVQPDADDRYRCRVGHAYSAQSLLGAQTDALEKALWTAIRALREKSDCSTRVANSLRSKNQLHLAKRFERQATKANQEADSLLSLIKISTRDSQTRSSTSARSLGSESGPFFDQRNRGGA